MQGLLKPKEGVFYMAKEKSTGGDKKDKKQKVPKDKKPKNVY
jgi:hypothetical protein